MNKKIKNCKEGTINVSIMNLILAILFCFESVTLFMIYEARSSASLLDIILPIIIFCGTTITGIFFTFKRILRNIRCRHRGEIVKAVVHEYLDDNVEIYDKRAYLIRFLVHNNDGDEIIYYRSLDTSKRYAINSEIELFKYKDQYLIKDAQKNKKEKIMSIISILVILIPILIFSYKVFPTEYNKLKIKYIDSHNNEIRTKFDVIKYTIPDDFKLVSFSDDKYEFVANDSNHYCRISINKHEASDSACGIGWEEEIINNNAWCVDYLSNNKLYEKTIGGYAYLIEYYTSIDNDEFCSINFKKFEESLKVNTK